MIRTQLFPQLINNLNIQQGVEVGVAAGLHAANILSRSTINKLYCVDPYPDDLPAAPEKDGDKRFQEAQRTLHVWIKNRRAEIIRKTGLEAVKDFQPDVLGFVYLDGDRATNVFDKEIRAWHDILQVGGILSGHDYKTRRGWGTIKQIIDDFVDEKGYNLHVSTGVCPSWWVIKE